MTKDQENTKIALQTFESFFAQFGNDEQSRLVLEILFEEMMNAVPVSGQQKQEGD